MAQYKQSATYTRMFLLVLSSDHVSPATGLTPAVNLSKNGAAFAAAAGVVTEVSGGWYKIALTTVDTNTLGDLAFHITAATADNTDFCDQVSLFDPIGGVVPTLTTYTGNTPQTGDAFARLGAPAGASIAADLAEIEGETDGIAAIPTSNPTTAQIATAVWQDATASDFTAVSSIGKSLLNMFTVAGGSVLTAAALNNCNVASFGGSACVLDANNLPKVDTADYGGFTVQVDGNNLPSVNVQDWHGAAVGIPNVAGYPQVDVRYLLGTISAGTAGYVALDWAHITGQATAQNLSLTTINLCNTITTYTGNTPQTGDSFARLGAPAGASVSADIAAIKANTTTLVTGVTVSAYASGQDPATLVWAQAMTELVAVPAVTDTILHALEWMFIVSHNKITETSSTQLVRNHADSATIGTSTVSDDGTTFTRGGYV